MFPTTQNSPKNLASALKESNQVDTSAADGSGVSYLQFSGETGIFKYGREGEEVNGDTIVINSYSFVHGWALWVDKKVEKRTASFVEPLPEAMEPKKDRRGKLQYPSELRGFQARFLDDDETILSLEGNSFGVRKGVGAVLNEVSARAAKGEERFLFPVCELSNESYESNEGKTVFNPVFDILYWVDENGEQEPEGAMAVEDKSVEDQAPAEEKSEAPAEEKAEAPAEEKAPRRRRRRAAE